MIDDFDKKALEKWVLSSLQKASDQKMISIHFDELFDKNKIMKRGLNYWLDLYTFLTLLPYDKLTFKAIMTLPLVCKKNLDCNEPTLEEIGQKNSEPPSFYLVSRQLDQFLENREEYIRPIELKSHKNLGKNVRIYYRAYRQEEAFRLQWEYSRCVYLEHYEDSLIF